MMKKVLMMVVVGAFIIPVAGSYADLPTLSIYEIQYTTNADGTSNWDTQKVNCKGGIVIHKWSKGRQRVVLYDPNNADGWGGIVVKADLNTTPFNSVNLGDWITLNSVTVYDWINKSRGNTILYLDNSSTVNVLSTGHPLPAPLLVDVNDIAVVYNDVNETCYVTNHRAEKYEGMYIKVRTVTVGDVNVGNSLDNYSLKSKADPNIYCWASDYMNKDKSSGQVHLPIVESGQHFCSVSGILEQYTYLDYGWDYYQLLTTSAGDLKTQTGDLDGDCNVDFADFAYFAQQWLNDSCSNPGWCGGADFSKDGIVDEADLAIFVDNWLSITD